MAKSNPKKMQDAAEGLCTALKDHAAAAAAEKQAKKDKADATEAAIDYAVTLGYVVSKKKDLTRAQVNMNAAIVKEFDRVHSIRFAAFTKGTPWKDKDNFTKADWAVYEAYKMLPEGTTEYDMIMVLASKK